MAPLSETEGRVWGLDEGVGFEGVGFKRVGFEGQNMPNPLKREKMAFEHGSITSAP